MQIGKPLPCSSGKEERSTHVCRFAETGRVTELTQSANSAFDSIRPRERCRRDDADVRAMCHGRRFEQCGCTHQASPHAIMAAGPVSASSVPAPLQATVCAPPGAITRNGEVQLWNAIAVTAD